MPRRQEAPIAYPNCARPGCAAPGEYKAPLSREALREYQWLCLDHIRAFNKEWNYFSGMSSAEIESFMHDAVTGHRPTWDREGPLHGHKNYERLLEEELRIFRMDRKKLRDTNGRKLTPKERKALTAMELEAPIATTELKQHYRGLVKRYHPDLHSGDRDVEEKFKQINAAYAYLLALYQAPA